MPRCQDVKYLKCFILFKTSLFHRAYSYLVFVGYNQIDLIFVILIE